MKKLILLCILALAISSCNKKEEEVIKPEYRISDPSVTVEFSSDNAFLQVEKQVSFGPRNPGSKGHAAALEYFSSELKKYADTVVMQNFSIPGYNEQLNLTNIIAKFNPKASKRIFFAAHWDSRPRSDEDKDSTKRNKPIPGANDGGSGVGILLELARVLKSTSVDYGIDIILLDGEDYGHSSDLNNYCLGAKYFASTLPNDYRPSFGILLDLVGDKEARFLREGNSMVFAPDVANMVWQLAAKVNAGMFIDSEGSPIYDDHIPLNQSGLKTIDIIDIDLVGANTPNPRRNYWHTQSDDMRNISKETLGQVGRVLVRLVYSLRFDVQ